MHVWGVNLTVTVTIPQFRNTSERVTRRCDHTSWQESSEFLCIKTDLFLREFGNDKKRPKTPEMLFLTPC